MRTIPSDRVETREEALARIRRTGKAALTLDELYGPGPAADDPEDLEAFLALLDSMRQPVTVPADDE